MEIIVLCLCILSVLMLAIIPIVFKRRFEAPFTTDKKIVILIVILLGLLTFLSIIYKFENYIAYAIIYLIIGALIFKLGNYDLVSAPMLFYAFYTFVIGLSPTIFLWYNVHIRYDYYIYILGPLLLYTLALALCSNIKIKRIHEKDEKKKKFGLLKKKNILRIILYISVAASIYFAYKNIDMYINNNIYAGRMDAISGSGLLVYITQLPIIIIPMFYEMIGNKNEKIKLWEFILYFIISSVSLLVTGFRTPLLLMLMVLTVMFIKKKKLKQSVIVLIAVALISLVFGLDILRGRNPLASIYKNNSINNSHPIMVNAYNLNGVISHFPKKIPYQKGYTYLINIIMLKPGPDLDYTLWLKKVMHYKFDGGGVTPTINGEFYMNFGTSSIYMGFLLLGVLSVALNKLSKKRKNDFLSTYLVVQYFHCVSGGIANVIIPVSIMLVVYFVIYMISYNEVKNDG